MTHRALFQANFTAENCHRIMKPELTTRSNWLYQSETLLSMGLLGVLVIMLVPLPPALLDMLLAVNLSLSILVILITLNTKKPLEFAVFPSLLLLLTLFRLSLNVATTRLILLSGHAGSIVEAFGNFVVGGNLVVGLVIFLILIVIQFVVITKGSGRISEVAARFTLDALPGKQMAIDAELNAGAIDEVTARRRRTELAHETEFYGAMDGASKFVRGDAIAGLIITAINLTGGVILGVSRGMSLGGSITTYSILTVGDGLISQVPALIIATSAGILVTKTTSDTSLGQEIETQFFRQERPLWAGVGILVLLAFSPGMPAIPFLAIAGGLVFYLMKRKKADSKKAAVEEQTQVSQPAFAESSVEDEMREFLSTDRATIEVGPRLVALINPKSTKGVAERIRNLRLDFSREKGLWIPPIRVRSSLQLEPDQYRVMIAGRQVGGGTLLGDRQLAIAPEHVRVDIPGIATREPAFDLAAKWIDPSLINQAEAHGYTVVDAVSVLITHLGEILKRHAHELITRETLKQMLDRVRDFAPTIVDELKSESVRMSVLHQVVQRLAEEGVPLTDLTLILEAAANHGPHSKTADELTDRVREDLGRLICDRFKSSEGHLRIIAFDPKLESKLRESLRNGQLAIGPVPLDALMRKVGEIWQNSVRHEKTLALLTDRALRRPLRHLLMRTAPGMGFIAYQEVPGEISLDPVEILSHADIFAHDEGRIPSAATAAA
ncbi:flagellar biosynthesis protein FlhA [Planctomicrobium sp. SH668]|uniref:flagellar biosynthesis protein FlhA n=1 Tax=Planctomicrobium sp. SH668 TaxID=3448126 RepID=UPI003F5C80E6